MDNKMRAAIDWLLVGLGALLSQTPLSSMKYLEALAAFCSLVRAQNLKGVYPGLEPGLA